MLRSLIDVVAPVFAGIALGWLAARRAWMDTAGFRGLTWLFLHVAAPALLFVGGVTAESGAGGRAALAFFLGAGALYALCLWLGRVVLRRDLGAAGALALNATFGNTVMMGIPLIAAAYGAEGLALLLAIIALHALILLGAATVVAEIALHAHAPWRRVLRATLGGVLRNPVVMAVAAALLWRTLDLPPLPDALRRTLELLGAATPGVALFCLGGSLAGVRAEAGPGAWREAALTSALKLAAMPLLVWGAALLLGLGPRETAVAVVVAALPTGANAFLLAGRYGIGTAQTGATVLLSTALSLVTLAVLLALFPAR